MPEYLARGIYVEVFASGHESTQGAPTSVAAFVGRAVRAPFNKPVEICNLADYHRVFDALSLDSTMSFAVQQFFENGGHKAYIVRVGGEKGGESTGENFIDNSDKQKGIHALTPEHPFNLLCLPPTTFERDPSPDVLAAARGLCHKRRAMLIVDSPCQWNTVADAERGVAQLFPKASAADRNVMVLFPRLHIPSADVQGLPPCGAAAGVVARMDEKRGVWKSPAGRDAKILGADGLTIKIAIGDAGRLITRGTNTILQYSGDIYIWGTRTLAKQTEWKYVSVRRLYLFLEESIRKGTQWAVFEANDERLWKRLRLTIGAFMQHLFRHGAFAGSTPAEAYFVKCDSETTTKADLDLGVVNILVGFAPVEPAKFVLIEIQLRLLASRA